MKRTLFICSMALCLWGCSSPTVAPAKEATPPTVAPVDKAPTISLEAIFLRVPADKLPALKTPTRNQLLAILADSPDSCRMAMLKVITIPGKKVTAVSGERVPVTTAIRVDNRGDTSSSFEWMDQGVVLKAMPFWKDDRLFLTIDTTITEIVRDAGIVLQEKPLLRGTAIHTHDAKTVIPCTPGLWMVVGGRNIAKFKLTTKPKSATQTIPNVWYLMLQADFVSPEPSQP
jgi:hypothetical protein